MSHRAPARARARAPRAAGGRRAVIADGGQYRNGVPTLGSASGRHRLHRRGTRARTTQRGAVRRTVPDALIALCRILASLHDDRGDVAIGGLKRFAWRGAPVSEDELREESNLLPSVQLLGTGPIADQLLSGAAVSVLGIDAPRVAESSNQLVPSARARVSLRLAPGDDARSARDKLVAHLEAAAPWGVEVEIRAGEAGQGYIVDSGTPAHTVATKALAEAWGRDVVEIGSGGSISLIPMLCGGAFPGLSSYDLGSCRRHVLLPLDLRRERGPGPGRGAGGRRGSVPPRPGCGPMTLHPRRGC